MAIIRCIPVSVFRSGRGDCTNGGVSGRFSELLIACPDGFKTIDTDVAIPLNFCHVRRRDLYLGRRVPDTIYDVRPATVDDDGNIVDRGDRWYMFGGNFAYTSDSRFSDLHPGFHGAVAIHDRWER